MTGILPSYIRDTWWTPASTVEGTVIRDASTGEEVARVSTEGLDLAATLDYARTVGQASPRHAHLPPACRAAQADGPAPHRAQSRAVRDLQQHRCHDRPTRGSTSTAASACSSPTRRKGRRELPNSVVYVDGPVEIALEGRLLPRPAHLHAPARRRRADQRLQLPGVGVAREVRARVPRRRADRRETGHPDRLPRRGRRAHPRRVGPAA